MRRSVMLRTIKNRSNNILTNGMQPRQARKFVLYGSPKQITESVFHHLFLLDIKDPEDKKRWLIDEPAAEIVHKIFALSLGGRGPSQIV